MRKYIILILALFSSISSIAENVSSSKAMEIASSIFGTTRSGRVSLVWSGSDGTRGSNPAFYVFNCDGGGFVVISAEDKAYPILGYSEKGSFCADGIPAHIRAWFDGYSREIEFLRASDFEQRPEIAALWQKVTTPSPIKDLKTAQWGQGTPFNNKCWKDEKSSTKSYAGCVATSTATIMYHHKWPKSTSGAALPSYTYEYEEGASRTEPSHNLSASYDWDNMISSYNGIYSKEAGEAVSTLMFDVGVAMQLSYGTDGTGGYSEDIAPILVKYFGYDSCAVLLYRNEMSSKKWSDRMKAEIDAGRPVSYSASDRILGGGHQFVLDGYGTEDYFHFNFGWNGECDGLYRVEAVTPDIYHFNYSQSAIVNIKPNEGGTGKDREKRIRFIIDNNFKGGLSIIDGTIAKGNTVKIAALNFCNFNSGYIEDTYMEDVAAEFAMCLMSRDNKVKETYGKTRLGTIPSMSYSTGDTISCKITKDIELGDKFMFCYRTNIFSEDWIPVELDYSLYNYSSGSSIYNISDAIAAYDFPAIRIDPAGYKANELIDLRLENCMYIPTIVWYVNGTELDNGINSVRLPAGKHTLRAKVTFYKTNTVNGSVIRTENLYRVIEVN